MPRRTRLDDIVRTLVAYLESKGAHRGYPHRLRSVRKACKSPKLRQSTGGRPAPYATVYNRLDKALRGPILPVGGRGPPVVTIDPVTNALVFHSLDRLLDQFPPSAAALREAKRRHPEQPPDTLPYLCFLDCLTPHFPRPPLNIVHCIADSGDRCNYLDPTTPSPRAPRERGWDT